MKARFLLAAILTTSTLHADVLHVAYDGSGDYTQIQAAVDAALDGDTILVQPGIWYDGFTIVDKDLRVVSAVLGAHARVRGCSVLDLSEEKQVLLGRLRLEQSVGEGLVLDQCAGSVRIDECVMQSSFYTRGAYVQNSADVSLVDCVVAGGDGTSDLPWLVHGASALTAVNSRVAITSCTFRGGEGVESWDSSGYVYGNGGDAARFTDSFAYLSASVYEGGKGAAGGGNDGRAVDASVNSDAQLHDNTYLGQVSGSTRTVPGKARVLQAPVFEADGVSTIRVQGKPGDRVALFWATTPDFRYLRRQRGVLLSTPPFGLADEGWVVDASGELEFTWTPPAAPAGDGRLLHLQARIDRGGAVPRLTNVASMLVVDWP